MISLSGVSCTPRAVATVRRSGRLAARVILAEHRAHVLVEGRLGNQAPVAHPLEGPLLPHRERLLVAVNYAAHPSQCCVRLPFPDLGGGHWRLADLLGDACFERAGDDLQSRGLYLDVPPWQAHVFAMSA